MNTQTKEAARQILGDVSDIQAVLSMYGSRDVNLKLAAIREKAAFLFEGGKGTEQIIAGYQVEAQDSLIMLSEQTDLHMGGRLTMNDAELIKVVRLAEIFISRVNVYFDRKTRVIMEGSDVG